MTELFESAVNHLRNGGIYQWDSQYPNKDTVRSDIELGCLLFAEKRAADNGYSSIRLDAYSGNAIALQLYERNGYRKRGEVFFPRRELPFICYEKLLQ